MKQVSEHAPRILRPYWLLFCISSLAGHLLPANSFFLSDIARKLKIDLFVIGEFPDLIGFHGTIDLLD